MRVLKQFEEFTKEGIVKRIQANKEREYYGIIFKYEQIDSTPIGSQYW